MTAIGRWLGAVAFVYVALSGLALWSHQLYWISAVLGGGTLARAMHPIVALVLVVAYLSRRPAWMHVTGAVLLLASGAILWYPEDMPRWARLIAVVLHPLAAIGGIGGIIVHSRWFRERQH
jgi:cytochrome b subunit of formate dehydrogenase